MPVRTTLRFSLIVLTAALTLSRPWPAAGVPYDPNLPFTYLFDTGSSASEPLSRQGLAEKTGWTLVDEETGEHNFQGDAVLLNDKLLIVLRAKGPGAEVYTRNGRGWKSRAVLMSLSGRSTAVSGASSIRILENSPAAVMLRAEFTTTGPGGNCSSTFRLTTGQRIVEMQAGAAADRLFVWCRPRWVVVPDFFGDDMIFGSQSFGSQSFGSHPSGSQPSGSQPSGSQPSGSQPSGSQPAAMLRMGLPTENFFLNLIRGGEAMIMAVWPSGRQASYAIADGGGPDRTLLGCEIEGAESKPLWVAFFEGQNLWHEETIPADTPPEQLAPDFQPPFDAQWRADLVRPDGFAVSRPLGASDESSGQPISAVDSESKGDGPSTRSGSQASQPSAAAPIPLVIYPLDRTRKTPLTAFCPTDVIRNTLGVGPCQYVLETEGLATETNPTPDQVMTWIERQFERNQQADAADEIRELLEQMTEHVGHAQARIDQYRNFARQSRSILAAAAKEWQTISVGAAPVQYKVERTLARLDRILAAPDPAIKTCRRAEELAQRVVDLVDKPDTLAECRRLGEQLRWLGTVQDTTLSTCRMTVRWLRQQTTTLAAADPQLAEAAEKLQTSCGQLLRNQLGSAQY